MNVPDERLRAAADLIRKIQACDISDCLLCAEQAELVARFAKEREDSAMREAAGLVCGLCGNQTIAKAQLFGNVWGHPVGRDNYVPCKAAPIYEHLARKGDL
jgi:hypothetical protein